MKQILKFLISLTVSFAILSVVFIPNVSRAGLVPCGTDVYGYKDGKPMTNADLVNDPKTIEANNIIKAQDGHYADVADKNSAEGRQIYTSVVNAKKTYEAYLAQDISGVVKNPCGFNDIITLINNIIRFIMILAIPIVAVMFVYAGFLLVTSGGEASAKTKAKGIFFNAVIGLILVVGAWLIIKTISVILGYTSNPFF